MKLIRIYGSPKIKLLKKFHIENMILAVPYSIFLDTVIPCRTQSTHDN